MDNIQAMMSCMLPVSPAFICWWGHGKVKGTMSYDTTYERPAHEIGIQSLGCCRHERVYYWLPTGCPPALAAESDMEANFICPNKGASTARCRGGLAGLKEFAHTVCKSQLYARLHNWDCHSLWHQLSFDAVRNLWYSKKTKSTSRTPNVLFLRGFQ